MYVSYAVGVTVTEDVTLHKLFPFPYKMSEGCGADALGIPLQVAVCVCLQVLDQRESVHDSAYHTSLRVHGSKSHLPLQHHASPSHQTEGRAPRRLVSSLQHDAPGLFASQLTAPGILLFVHVTFIFTH